MSAFVHPSDRTRGITAMVAAVSLFSLCGALVAATSIAGMAAVALTSIGSGVALLAFTFARGSDRSRVPARTVASLTVLNVAQIGLYYMALKLAPTGPAAALHLCTPVILLIWFAAAGRRRLGGRELATTALLICGCALAAVLTPQQHGSGHHALLGLSLALLSSVAMAALIMTVFTKAHTMSLQFCNALKGLIGGGALLPFAIVSPPHVGPALIMLGVGAFLSAPGLALAWFALARVQPTTTSTIDLLEAVFTPAAGTAIFGVAFAPTQVLVMAPILAAAFIEVRRPPEGSPQRQAEVEIPVLATG